MHRVATSSVAATWPLMRCRLSSHTESSERRASPNKSIQRRFAHANPAPFPQRPFAHICACERYLIKRLQRNTRSVGGWTIARVSFFVLLRSQFSPRIRCTEKINIIVSPPETNTFPPFCLACISTKTHWGWNNKLYTLPLLCKHHENACEFEQYCWASPSIRL